MHETPLEVPLTTIHSLHATTATTTTAAPQLLGCRHYHHHHWTRRLTREKSVKRNGWEAGPVAVSPCELRDDSVFRPLHAGLLHAVCAWGGLSLDSPRAVGQPSPFDSVSPRVHLCGCGCTGVGVPAMEGGGPARRTSWERRATWG